MMCTRCGGIFASTSNGNFCSDCEKTRKEFGFGEYVGIAQGWICPQCGSVWSPYQVYCPVCVQYSFTVGVYENNMVNSEEKI